VAKHIFFADIQACKKNIDTVGSTMNQMIKYAKDNSVKFAHFLGDAFEDKRHIDVVVFNRLFKLFHELSEIVEIHIIPGNHDFAVYGNEHSLSSFFPLSSIHTTPTETNVGELRCHYIPYARMKYLPEHFRSTAEVVGRKDVLCFHCDVDGVKIGKFKQKGVTKKDMLFSKYARVFGGHIHNRQKLADNAYYVGSLFAQDFGEVGDNSKGFYVMDDISMEVNFVGTDAPGYIEIWSRDDYERYKDVITNSHVRLCISDEDIVKDVNQRAISVKETLRDSGIERSKNDGDFDVNSAVEDYLTEFPNSDKRMKQFQKICSRGSFSHRDVEILSLRGENVLSYKDLYIDFQQFTSGMPISIFGKNMDEDGYDSNGAGKSGIIEVLFEGLFGKSLRGRKASDIINWDVGKGCFVEVKFKVNGIGYTIKRYRNHSKNGNAVFLLKEGENLPETPADGKSNVQNDIDSLLSDYVTFKSLVLLGKHTESFSLITPSERFGLFEEILGITWIDGLLEKMKKKFKVLRDKADDACRTAETLDWQRKKSEEALTVEMAEIAGVKSKEENFLRDVKAEIIALEKQEKTLKTSYNANEKSAEEFEKKLNKYLAEETKITEKWRLVDSKMKEGAFKVDSNISRAESFIKEKQKKIQINIVALKKGEEVECDFCYSQYKPGSIVEKLEKEIAEIRKDILIFGEEKMLVGRKMAGNREKLDKFMVGIKQRRRGAEEECLECRRERREISVALAKVGTHLEHWNESGSKYDEAIESINKRIRRSEQTIIKNKTDIMLWEEKKDKLKKQLSEVDFWVEAFGKNGFRQNLFDAMMPFFQKSMNAYLLDFGVTAKVEKKGKRNDIMIYVKKQNGKFCEYSSFSDGERNRVDLSVLLSLYKIASMLTMKVNLIFWDEFITNLDETGAEITFKIAKEFMKKNDCIMFSISHLSTMNSLFDKYISVVKRSGVSVIEEIVA